MNAERAEPIQPFHFGSGRRLFGLLHGIAAPSTRPAVLVCNPFGQEAVRAHRMLRVLADRLARDGHTVLRFDYFGTGDSLGDGADADLDTWTDDVLQADQQLLRHAPRRVWVGMGLGAAVALRAAQRAPAGLTKLVLWDMVVDGERYLSFLRDRHVASLDSAFSILARPTARERAVNPQLFHDEALGFELPQKFLTQVRSIATANLQWPSESVSTVLLADPDTVDGRELGSIARDVPRLKFVGVSHGTDWTTASAENSALVPARALSTLLEQIGTD